MGEENNFLEKKTCWFWGGQTLNLVKQYHFAENLGEEEEPYMRDHPISYIPSYQFEPYLICHERLFFSGNGNWYKDVKPQNRQNITRHQIKMEKNIFPEDANQKLPPLYKGLHFLLFCQYHSTIALWSESTKYLKKRDIFKKGEKNICVKNRKRKTKNKEDIFIFQEIS